MDHALVALDRLYADTPGVVRRAGRSYPVAVTALPDAVVRLVDGTTPVDGRLLAAGRGHLDALRSAGRVHDGPVLCLDQVLTSVDAPAVEVVRGGYFDMLATCDAVRAELDSAADEVDWERLPLRVRAHEVAGDPLVSGAGRSAAVGVSVLLVVRDAVGTPGVVLGRRSSRVGADAGRWHVAPSGMLEPAAGGGHLATTVLHELEEELGVAAAAEDVDRALRVLGVVTDLMRLRPDVVVLLEADALRPGLDAADLVAGEEFDELEVVPLTVEDLGDLWRRRPPEQLTAPAAGALALAEVRIAAARRRGTDPFDRGPVGRSGPGTSRPDARPTASTSPAPR